MTNVTLIKATVGLTNHYQNQVIRNPSMNIDTTIIDQLTSENMAGSVSATTLAHAAIHSGGLNIQATDYASISGGWNESKGLMKLDFVTQDSPVLMEYMSVIGYITNNASMEGLTGGALFHPVMSWKSQERTTSSGYLENPVSIQRKIGGRTDYMFNDGSNHNPGLMTLRPADVIECAINNATREDTLSRMVEEGINNGVVPITSVGASDINRAGIVPSRRENINPILYASEILKAGTKYQSSKSMSGLDMDMGYGNMNDGMYGELTEIAYQSGNAEPNLLHDDFFGEMMSVLGSTQTRGFTGYTISDLLVVFENLDDVLDLTLQDTNTYSVNDFTQNTESMGTSAMAELIAHEIESNILELLLKYDLAGLSFRGSNCDNFGEVGLGNIVILPYNPSPLKDDDYQLGQKIDAFSEALRNQIFAKLQGLRSSDMVPLRFDVTAELFGTCIVNIQIVDDTNFNNGFSLEETGVPTGMRSYSFPTFAINTTSSMLGTSESSQLAGSNFYQNLETYF